MLVADLGAEIELPRETKEKLDGLDRNVRYMDPIEWGVDLYDQHTPEEVKAKVAEHARQVLQS